MSYLHTKFHDNWISSFRGVAMTRFWDGRTDGRSDPTSRPAFAFGDAGKKPLKICLCFFECSKTGFNHKAIWRDIFILKIPKLSPTS